ncbi:hypothetical protein NITLEN_10715 [Nitrospira lenta]|uniref:Uncharacterized protein n=1 Tax=Nitrospira lenta TaxID=1436998 RepID=A0A330L363_9BACT|nr:hypothetical protein NITLEN_10715 [Nitrospira lenta]
MEDPKDIDVFFGGRHRHRSRRTLGLGSLKLDVSLGLSRLVGIARRGLIYKQPTGC